MKKLFIALLCLLLTGLYACKQVEPPEEKTTATTISRETTQVTSIETTVSEKSTGINAATDRYGQSVVEIKTSKDDPYSFIIQDYYQAMNDKPSVSTYQYFLYDIDGNGIQELLLGLENYGLDCVYTIQNGVAVQQRALLVDMVENSPPILFSNGTIKMDNAVSEQVLFGDYLRYYYFRFEDGELKRYATLMTDGERFGCSFATADGDIIPKAEFDRVQKEFEGDGQTVELDWKPLAEYGR